MDLVMRIELTRAILSRRLSDFLRNSIIHFRIFLNLVTCFWVSQFRSYAGHKLYHNSKHCLFSSLLFLQEVIHWSFKYHGAERPNLQADCR